jgi:hypothetical protein
MRTRALMREEELLRIRGRYPQATGWETAKKWIFSPGNSEQVSLGIKAVLGNGLFSEFVDYAGTAQKESLIAPGAKEFKWQCYIDAFLKIKDQCEDPLLTDLIWSIYSWAIDNKRETPYRYLSEAVDSVELVTLLSRRSFLKELIEDIIAKHDTESALLVLKQVFEGVESEPRATALLVINFIHVIRDAGDSDKVMAGFFEGFELQTPYGVSWKAAPMLKALSDKKNKKKVLLYEDFLRHLFFSARTLSQNDWATWKRAYDQEFQLWINLFQSGMFNPDVKTEY